MAASNDVQAALVVVEKRVVVGGIGGGEREREREKGKGKRNEGEGVACEGHVLHLSTESVNN